MSERYYCCASAAFGLEGLVADELRSLQMSEVRTENGDVRFTASPEDVFLCNIKLHFCDRVFIIAAEGKCLSFEDLYQLVFSVQWQRFLTGNEFIHVSAKCVRSVLMSPRDCQSITKKAIINELMKETAKKVFPEDGPEFPVLVSIHNDHARILINTSGEALSRRGYRTWNGEAPLRETLASALVRLSPWKPELPLYDPCCGTGTILIEAAFFGARRAPGLNRHFAMEQWKVFQEEALGDIRKRVQQEYDSFTSLKIAGSDIDPEAVKLAQRHLNQSGLQQSIGLEIKALQTVELTEDKGVFICNPPYGERLSDQKACRMLYKDLKNLKDRHRGWAMCVITSDPSFERFFGKKADRKRRLYNGRLECTYYIYYSDNT